MLVGDLLRRTARRYPQKKAMVVGSTQYTYDQLNQRVNRLGNAWLASGLQKGQRVAVLADNCPQFAEIYFAGAKTGIVITPINPRLAAADIAYILSNAEPAAILMSPNYIDVVKSLRPQLGMIRSYFVLGGRVEGMRSYEELISQGAPHEPEANLRDDEIFLLAYTSGTTGLPKGVMYSHKGMLASTTEGLLTFRIAHQDVALAIVPFFHPVFLWFAISNFHVGATFIAQESFSPPSTLKTMEKEGITTVSTVVPIVASLVESPEITSCDLRSLRWIAYAGAPLPVALVAKGVKALGKKFINYYAMVETTGPVAVMPAEEVTVEGSEERLGRLGSCGKETINTDIKVVNEEGQEVPPGEVGEIIVRNEGLMLGYWRLPQLTAEAVKDGYYYSGDLGKKDTIVVGDQKVFPQEVEEVLYHHPAVLEAAVIGVSQGDKEEVLKAAVVLKEKKSISEGEIIELCRKSLPAYAVPQVVEFVDKLPRNPMGKILRRVLREQ